MIIFKYQSTPAMRIHIDIIDNTILSYKGPTFLEWYFSMVIFQKNLHVCIKIGDFVEFTCKS